MTYSAFLKKERIAKLWRTDKKTVERTCKVIEEKIKRGKR